MTTDQLIDRLRARAADPSRRVDAPQTELGAMIDSMGLAEMLGMADGLAGALSRVVDANRAGAPLDPELVAEADRLEASMSTPVDAPLSAPAEPAALDVAEATFGARLPAAFRRIYTEVADGGFGPGPGLLPIDRIVMTYREVTSDPPAPRGVAWPPATVPIVSAEPGFICLELPGGSILDWDPEGTFETQSAEAWARSFSELAPDIETWLGAWVDSLTPAEEREAQMDKLRREELRRTRARIAAMTPAEREAIGLPADGWESAYIDEDDL